VNYNDQCPSAGYPTPPLGCGCGCGSSPQPYPPPGSGYPNNPGPSAPLPLPFPSPIPAMAGDDGGILGALYGLADALGVSPYLAQRAADMANRKLCSKWETDGVNDHKICCTPSVGKGGVKVALCVKITRPHDPWASGGSPTNYGSPAPTWPVPQ